MILEFIKRRYEAEIEKITNLDGKANNLIGFVAVVVGLIVGGGAFKISIISAHIELWSPFFGGLRYYSYQFSLGYSPLELGIGLKHLISTHFSQC